MLELPSYYVIPLVQPEGQVAVRADFLSVVRIHGGFGGGTDGEALRELFLAAVRDPGDFSFKALEVVFFALEVGFGDEEREVAVADAHLFEADVEEGLDGFPDSV